MPIGGFNPLGAANASNPVVQGGVGLMVITAVAQWAKSAPTKAWRALTKEFWITVRADDHDESYLWIMRWLSQHLDEKRSTSYRVMSQWVEDAEDQGHRRVTALVPGPSQRVLKYQGVKMWVRFGEITEGTKRTDTVEINCRKRNRQALQQMFGEITELEKRPDPTVTKVFRPGMVNGGWQRHATRPVRAAESMILADGLYATIVEDARKFEGGYDWYLELGIPYRRSYLLDGAPGNGKSSLAMALAGALGRDLYVLPLGDPTFDDEKLVAMMGVVPTKALVVMEDIDTVFSGRERLAENKLTLSGLLNVLDGPLATEGRLCLMTTNHPERLDPALIRPGRVDVRFTLKNADPDQARRLYQRFYKEAPPVDVEQFAAWAGSGAYSMAQLQGHLVRTLGDPAAALTPLAVEAPVLSDV